MREFVAIVQREDRKPGDDPLVGVIIHAHNQEMAKAIAKARHGKDKLVMVGDPHSISKMFSAEMTRSLTGF